MAWHHVSDDTIRVPQYQTKVVSIPVRDSSGSYYSRLVVRSTKVPTGEVREVTHSVWRCGNCRALAAGEHRIPPDGPCLKCGARGRLDK